MDNQSIPTNQQMSLLESLVKSGVLSPEAIQSHAADNGPSQPQANGMNIDPTMLHSIIQHASNPNAVPMQQGDQMHPMDAMKQIAQGNQEPTSNLTAVQPKVAGEGLGSWISKMITGHPIMHDVGNPVIGTTNAPNVGNLPDSMKPQSIGTDSNGKPIYDYAALQKLQGYEGALATATAKGGISNPKYGIDQLTAMGIPVKDAAQLFLANPQGVTDKEIGKYQTQNKNSIFSAGVDVRKDMVQTMKDRIVAMFEGPGALQQTMKDAAQRSANIDRFYGVFKTVQDNGFQATQVQRNLLQTEAARVIAGSGGVITDDGYNRLASGTAAQKVSDWKSWMLNEATPAEFKSFADQLKSLMDNEYQVNHSIFAIGQKTSAQILGHSAPAVYTPGSAPNGVPMPSSDLNPNGSIPSANPSSGMLRVRNLKTGKTGMLPAANFDPNKYGKL